MSGPGLDLCEPQRGGWPVIARLAVRVLIAAYAATGPLALAAPFGARAMLFAYCAGFLLILMAS